MPAVKRRLAPHPNRTLGQKNKGFPSGMGETVTSDKLELATSYLVHVEPISPAKHETRAFGFLGGTGSTISTGCLWRTRSPVNPETFALLALWSRSLVGAG